MNKKQLKQEIKRLKYELHEANAFLDSRREESLMFEEKIAALEKEKLDHTWAERVLPRAIETLSLANAQHAEREAALIAEIGQLEAERSLLIAENLALRERQLA
jgi:hypothetical protein